MRGAENLLEVFCELFPEADIYTLIHKPGSTSKVIDSRRIHTSFLQKIPGIEKHYRKLLPLLPWATKSLKIEDDVDLVLSSSHCVIKGVKKPTKSLHLCYIHSPMRYIYDQFHVYFGSHAPLYQQIGASCFRTFLKIWDEESNLNVDKFIANSNFIKKRIQKYYLRDSDVIFPFVNLTDFESVQKKEVKKEDFYIVLSAFAPNKRVDLSVKAFNESGKKLKIIGTGQLEGQLKAMANKNIEFLGSVSREELVKQLAAAKALIFPGVEDFGITPLEALACGTPVIALGTGGVLDTLNEDVAVFFQKPTVIDINHAVTYFEQVCDKFDRLTLIKRSQEFSKERFKREIMDCVKRELETWQKKY
jgi:glycosyltransferase involved in cell wall biosynthesis